MMTTLLLLFLLGGCGAAPPADPPPEAAAVTYACPMHPQETATAPGQCSICGMDLEKVEHDHSTHDHGDH